jgi:hypothetical protein
MKILIIMLFLSFSFLSFSQTEIRLNFSDDKVKELAKEVYQDAEQYLTKKHLQSYKEFLNRIQIIEVSQEEMNKVNYPLISTLMLVSKYNSNIDYDQGPDFNINNFNPLKYFWIIKKDGSSDYYRINKDNYLIRLLPN